jgi:hypothetical protein
MLEQEMGLQDLQIDEILNTMTANDKVDSKIWIGNSGA